MAITIGAVEVAVRAKLAGNFRQDLARDSTAAADEAGTKAGTSFSDKFSKQAKTALVAGLAGVFAIAAKGSIELDTAVRGVAASAGIAASEMDAFQGRVVELFGANPSKGFQEIAETIGALKTNMGLTTEEAGKMAQQFLDFSKITGQTGPAAVKGLDDILDSFNLTAADSGRIMDLLVASQQKYGGTVAESQAALADLAPSLKALNVGLDDGVALLNVFQTAGLDASAATAALKKAVAGLKPGQNLNDLIAQISAIEDPTLRAQKAIEIFGAKGGVGLANAFRPGVMSLDEFKLSMAETTNAVTKGAAKIDDSFANKITSAFRTFISGPLASLGPGITTSITAVAGLATTFGSLGVTLDLVKIKTLALNVAMRAMPLIAIAAGLLEIVNRAQELGRVFDIVRLPDGFEKNAALIAELDKQIEGVSGALIQIPGQLEGLEEARRKLLALSGVVTVDVNPAFATLTGTILPALGLTVATVFDAVRVEALTAATRTAEATGAMGRDFDDFRLRVGELPADVKPIGVIGEATDEARVALAGDFDAMLKKIVDMRDPTKAAAEAYAAAVKDPIDVAQRFVEIREEIARIAPDLKSEAPNVAAAAKLYIGALETEMELLRDAADGYGAGTGEAYTRALARAMAQERFRVTGEMSAFRLLLEAHSPPGPQSPLHKIDVWGRKTFEAWGDAAVASLKSTQTRIAESLRSVASVDVSAFRTAAMPSFQAAPSLAYAAAGSSATKSYSPAASGPGAQAAPDVQYHFDMSGSTFMGSQAEIERFARQIRPVLARDEERRLALPTRP